MELKSKEEVLDFLEERSDWDEYSKENTYVTVKKAVLIGDKSKVKEIMDEKGIELDSETKYEWEISRELLDNNLLIPNEDSSKFQQRLLVNMAEILYETKKGRMTLKSNDLKVLNKHAGDVIEMDIEYKEGSQFYPILVKFEETELAYLISPMYRDK